jgi:enamine deaminase RidA (YjgF/YER057c/UK114 family)
MPCRFTPIFSACSLFFFSIAAAPILTEAQSVAQPQGTPMSVKRLLPTRYGYSNIAMTDGRLAFVSGQISEDEHGKFVGAGDFAAQTTRVFQNLQGILTHIGANQSDVVKINYYVVGITAERLSIVRAARNAMFNLDPKPASTLIGVANLFTPDALIEVEMVVRAPPQ